MGINAVVPVYDATGKFQGIFSNNFILSDISTFLSKLNFSQSGQTFIVERSGDLVATSTLELPAEISKLFDAFSQAEAGKESQE